MSIDKLLNRLRELSIVIILVALGLFILYSFIRYLTFNPLEITFQTTSSKIYDKNGELLWEISIDNATKNTPIEISSLPKFCIDAIVSVEDKTFWVNNGIDPNGIARLIYSILISNGTTGGGSTISQQVIKNHFLSIYNRDILDKYTEILYALKLNEVLPKETILEMYLNNIYFGEFNYGIESASQSYFGKTSSELNLAECSYLMGIPQWPGVYNPYGDLVRGIQRQKTVLQEMYQSKFIDANQYLEAVKFELQFKLKPIEVRAPHFTQFVSENLSESLGDSLYQNQRIDTTYDYTSHKKNLDLLQKFVAAQTSESNINNASLVVIDNQNNILNLIGSTNYFSDEIDGKYNSALGLRQPSQTLTPLIGLIEGESDNPNLNSEINELKQFNKNSKNCSEELLNEGCEISLLDLTSIYASNQNKANPIKFINSINSANTSNFDIQFKTYQGNLTIPNILIGRDKNNKDIFAISVDNSYTIGIWIGNTNGDEFNSIDESIILNLINKVKENF